MMKPISIILAGLGILATADPIFSLTTRFDDDASRTRIVTKTIRETTVRVGSSPQLPHKDSTSFENKNHEQSKNPPNAMPTTPSKHPPNHVHAESQDEVETQLDYWPIIIHLNGYDVEIPILRDNATKFCKKVMKDASRGKGGKSTILSVSDTGSSGNPTATPTPENKEESSSRASTIAETTNGTEESVNTISTKSEAADESSTDESDSFMATPTGKNSASAKPTVTPTPISSDPQTGNDEENHDDSASSTVATTDKSIQSSATDSESGAISTEKATLDSEKKLKQTVASSTDSREISKDNATLTSERVETNCSTKENLFLYTPFVTAISSNSHHSAKSKRDIEFLVKPDSDDDQQSVDTTTAVEKSAKPTFGIVRTSSTAGPVPTSDPSDSPDEDEPNSSIEEPSTTTQDDATSSKETRSSKTAEPTKPDPTPSDSSASTPIKSTSVKPSTTKASVDSATSTPSASSKESDSAAKHAFSADAYRFLNIFWGALFMSLGLLQLWRQATGRFHWNVLDERIGEYGRNVQADGRTPTQYALGYGKK